VLHFGSCEVSVWSCSRLYWTGDFEPLHRLAELYRALTFIFWRVQSAGDPHDLGR
jgi:hypothetical protein